MPSNRLYTRSRHGSLPLDLLPQFLELLGVGLLEGELAKHHLLDLQTAPVEEVEHLRQHEDVLHAPCLPQHPSVALRQHSTRPLRPHSHSPLEEVLGEDAEQFAVHLHGRETSHQLQMVVGRQQSVGRLAFPQEVQQLEKQPQRFHLQEAPQDGGSDTGIIAPVDQLLHDGPGLVVEVVPTVGPGSEVVQRKLEDIHTGALTQGAQDAGAGLGHRLFPQAHQDVPAEGLLVGELEEVPGREVEVQELTRSHPLGLVVSHHPLEGRRRVPAPRRLAGPLPRDRLHSRPRVLAQSDVGVAALPLGGEEEELEQQGQRVVDVEDASLEALEEEVGEEDGRDGEVEGVVEGAVGLDRQQVEEKEMLAAEGPALVKRQLRHQVLVLFAHHHLISQHQVPLLLHQRRPRLQPQQRQLTATPRHFLPAGSSEREDELEVLPPRAEIEGDGDEAVIDGGVFTQNPHQLSADPRRLVADDLLDHLRAQPVPLPREGLTAEEELELEEVVSDDRQEGSARVRVSQPDAGLVREEEVEVDLFQLQRVVRGDEVEVLSRNALLHGGRQDHLALLQVLQVVVVGQHVVPTAPRRRQPQHTQQQTHCLFRPPDRSSRQQPHQMLTHHRPHRRWVDRELPRPLFGQQGLDLHVPLVLEELLEEDLVGVGVRDEVAQEGPFEELDETQQFEESREAELEPLALHPPLLHLERTEVPLHHRPQQLHPTRTHRLPLRRRHSTPLPEGHPVKELYRGVDAEDVVDLHQFEQSAVVGAQKAVDFKAEGETGQLLAVPSDLASTAPHLPQQQGEFLRRAREVEETGVQETRQRGEVRLWREEVARKTTFPLGRGVAEYPEAAHQQGRLLQLVVGKEVVQDLPHSHPAQEVESETQLAQLIQQHAVDLHLQPVLPLAQAQLVPLRLQRPYHPRRGLGVVVPQQLFHARQVDGLQVLDHRHIFQKSLTFLRAQRLHGHLEVLPHLLHPPRPDHQPAQLRLVQQHLPLDQEAHGLGKPREDGGVVEEDRPLQLVLLRVALVEEAELVGRTQVYFQVPLGEVHRHEEGKPESPAECRKELPPRAVGESLDGVRGLQVIDQSHQVVLILLPLGNPAQALVDRPRALLQRGRGEESNKVLLTLLGTLPPLEGREFSRLLDAWRGGKRFLPLPCVPHLLKLYISPLQANHRMTEKYSIVQISKQVSKGGRAWTRSPSALLAELLGEFPVPAQL